MNNYFIKNYKHEERYSFKAIKFWILICLLYINPLFSAAQSTTFSISLKNASVESVLNELRNQSDLNFIYNNEQVKKCPPVTIKKVNASLREILDECLKDTGLTYKVVDDTVVITPVDGEVEEAAQPGTKPTQVVRGSVIDSDTKVPLIGATVRIVNSDPPAGTITNEFGEFRLEKIPVGRIDLQLSYIGYESRVAPNIVVNSAKEVVLALSMTESATEMEELVVTFEDGKGRVVNEMSIVSSRSISPEESNRYAGPFNDPTRIMSNYAGVAATQDGSNDIIVRGNSPKYVQWRLEGAQITNPSHFADQNGLSTGGISALNNNLLATSDFHTGAFSAEFGDVLSGVYDVKLRAGNNEKLEGIFGLGILGTDVTLEGPFKKGYGGSFLANYRYSTVGLMSDLGLVDVTGTPTFQDAAFKIVLPTAKTGMLSFFGLGGLSSYHLKDLTAADATLTPGDSPIVGNEKTDHQTKTRLLNAGLDYTFSLNKKGFLSSTFVFSQDGIRDNVFESQEVITTATEKRGVFDSRLVKSTYRGSLAYHHKFSAKNKISIGSNYSLFHYDYFQTQWNRDEDVTQTLVDFNEKVGTLRNYVSWQHKFNDHFTIVLGVHNMNVLFNKKSTIEPRIALSWAWSGGNTLSAGFGQHSAMETIHNYFAKVEHPDGSAVEPNRNLGLLKANHYVISYEKRFSNNLVGKIELYCQELYDIPVENNDSSVYSTINEGYEVNYVELVNKGKGRNHGVELSLERFFHNNFYFLINGSLYESKYTALDGVQRNTRFHNNFIVNVLAGKEFVNLGKKKNQVLGLNAKVFFGGGQKYIPLARDEEGNAIAGAWNYDRAYDSSLENLYHITLTASYKWNKPKTTHEIWLSLDNLTDKKGKLYEYYDPSKPNSVGYHTQFGFFPNLMYRVYF